MKTSNKGRLAIAGFEGVVTRAYPDPATGGEPWTIGVGHTSRAGEPKVHPGMVISRAEAFEILERDLREFERYVNSLVTVKLLQHEFDALVSFTFNVGPDIDDDAIAEGLGDSTLLRKLNAGDKAGAAREFTKWNRAAGRVLKGLTKRRRAEKAIFLHADYGDGAKRVADGEPAGDDLLVHGMQGDAVELLQGELNLLGADIDEDGLFGDETREAVKELQRDAGNLVEDGKVGPATRAAIDRLMKSVHEVPVPPKRPDVPEAEEPMEEENVITSGSKPQLVIAGIIAIIAAAVASWLGTGG